MLLCSGDLGPSGDATVDVGDARDKSPPAREARRTERLRLLPCKPRADPPFSLSAAGQSPPREPTQNSGGRSGAAAHPIHRSAVSNSVL